MEVTNAIGLLKYLDEMIKENRETVPPSEEVLKEYLEARSLLDRGTPFSRDLLGVHAEKGIELYQAQIDEAKKLPG